MKVQLSTVALLSERYLCEYMKLCNHMIKRTEWCPPLNIIVFENAVIYAQFFFFFMEKSCSHLEIFIFHVLNHSFNYENRDVMMCISTPG